MKVDTLIKDTAGNVWVNPARKYCVGTLLAPDPALVPITAAAAAAGNPGRAAPIVLEGAQNAVSEIHGLIGEHDASEDADVSARESVLINDLAYRHQLMNRDILVDHVFGSYQLPFPLKETIGLESQQNLLFNFLNNSTAGASSYRMAARALKMESSEETAKMTIEFAQELSIRKSFCSPYWLTSDATISLAASAANQRAWFTNTRGQTLILFYVMVSTVKSSSGGSGDTQEEFTADLYDGLGRLLTNQPVTKTMLAGTAQKPYCLPWPIILLPSNQMYVDLTNLITNRTLEVFLTFHGVSVYEGTPLWNARDIQIAQPVVDFGSRR